MFIINNISGYVLAASKIISLSLCWRWLHFFSPLFGYQRKQICNDDWVFSLNRCSSLLSKINQLFVATSMAVSDRSLLELAKKCSDTLGLPKGYRECDLRAFNGTNLVRQPWFMRTRSYVYDRQRRIFTLTSPDDNPCAIEFSTKCSSFGEFRSKNTIILVV